MYHGFYYLNFAFYKKKSRGFWLHHKVKDILWVLAHIDKLQIIFSESIKNNRQCSKTEDKQ